MSEQENVAIVKQLFATFSQGDIETGLNLYADDIEWQLPGSREVLPWAGIHRGREQVRQVLALMAEVAEFEQWEPRELIAQGDTVVALFFERFRVKATGRAVDNDFVMVFTFSDGKIVRWRAYEDTVPIIAALRGQDTI